VGYREVTSRIPIWVRLPAVILLVLAGVLIATMLLYNTNVGEARSGGHGSRGGMQMNGSDMSGDHSGGEHDSRGDHSGGNHGTGGGDGS
jgi:uncharacterized membrane protein